MPASMIEKVAEALFKYNSVHPAWDSAEAEKYKPDYLNLAKVAIEAMKEFSPITLNLIEECLNDNN